MLQLLAFILISGGLLQAQERSLDQAWKLAGSGHQDDAIRLLTQLVQQTPRNADAHLLLGSLLSERGAYEQAIKELKNAVTLRPDSVDAENGLGEAYTGFGDQKAAREAFEQAVRINPKSGIAQLNLGRTLLNLQEFAKAAPNLDAACELLGHDSDAADAHYLRAKIYAEQRDSRMAAKQLQQALAIRESFPEAWSDFGEARKQNSDLTGAITALKRAILLAPNDSVAEYRLGEIYLSQHRLEPAIAALRQADHLRPADQSTLSALLRALREDGQTEAAEPVKQQLAVILKGIDTDAQNNLTAVRLNDQGAELQSSGNLRGALEKYGEAVKLSPHNVTMRVNYAIAMLRLGQWTDGLNQLHESILMDPTNGKIKAALQDAIAQAPAGTVPKW